MVRRLLISPENLDVVGTSHDRKVGCAKDAQGKLAPAPHLYSLSPSVPQPVVQPACRRHYRSGGTITLSQATNIIEAVEYGKSIGLPLVAHLTIHWAYTNVGDDPNGKRFAKLREGISKWL